MTTLTAEQRQQCRRDFTEQLMGAGETTGITRPELQTAIDATDAWIDANAAAFNAALPLPARTALTTKQKARLFLMVARQRYEVI